MGPTSRADFDFEGAASLDAVLSPMHDAWVDEVRRHLVPAATAEAPFWDRWSVVRYLNDQFLAHFALERELLAELRPLLAGHYRVGIEAGAERVARLRLGLDRIGRRRGTAAEFALMVDELVTALELWCAEIELAVRDVDPDDLPDDAVRLLGQLDSLTQAAA